MSRLSARLVAGPRVIRGSGLADVYVRPLALAAETGVDRDELVARALEPGDGVRDDLEGGCG
jgi:hypothetical protein